MRHSSALTSEPLTRCRCAASNMLIITLPQVSSSSSVRTWRGAASTHPHPLPALAHPHARTSVHDPRAASTKPSPPCASPTRRLRWPAAVVTADVGPCLAAGGAGAACGTWDRPPTAPSGSGSAGAGARVARSVGERGGRCACVVCVRRAARGGRRGAGAGCARAARGSHACCV